MSRLCFFVSSHWLVTRRLVEAVVYLVAASNSNGDGKTATFNIGQINYMYFKDSDRIGLSWQRSIHNLFIIIIIII